MIKNRLIKNAKKVDKFLINYLKTRQLIIDKANEVWGDFWRQKD